MPPDTPVPAGRGPNDPATDKYPKPPFPKQQQPWPGLASKLDPKADHGEESYRGSGRLKGRKALITGGDSGIGRAAAIAFAREGADVAINYLPAEEPDAREVVDIIRAAGRKAIAIPGDIKDETFCRQMVKKVTKDLGGLDILVNNAAVVDIVGFDALTFEHYSRILRVNLDGALIVSMAMVPLIRSRTAHGRILNIASIMGVRSAPGATAYSTAKGGVVNLTRSMACDLAKDGIVVNAIAPGFIDTPMCLLPDGSGHEHQQAWFQDIYIKYKRIPLGRAGLPDDVAGPAAFFCSDDARYVTGQIVLVDGGVSATF